MHYAINNILKNLGAHKSGCLRGPGQTLSLNGSTKQKKKVKGH